MLLREKLTSTSIVRQKIRDFHRIDENKALDYILPYAEVSMSTRSRAWERARNMVLRIRAENASHGGIDALLNEFSLSTAEGVVLMCLAEALLRVPDKNTQDTLIRDKLSQGHWAPHLGNSDSLFVNASAWGLMFTGTMVTYNDAAQQTQLGLLKKTLGRLGEPVIRRAMNIALKVMGRQFVMSESIEEACKRAEEKEKKGYVYSYDMLGEGARTVEDAQRYYDAYEHAIHVIGATANGKDPKSRSGISVKLSAIHPRYDFKKGAAVVEEISAKLKSLCVLAKSYNIGLTVDAEESERLEISLDIIENVFEDKALAQWSGFGMAVQAYQKRAIFVIDWIRECSLKNNKQMMVRLVKGAYWDSEIKHAQQGGHNEFTVFTRKSSTDVSYHACANKLLAYRDTIYPQFATHNAYTASVILELAGDDKKGFEFQCLHGMGDTLYEQIVTQDKIQCRVYAPVGLHEDLLAYLVRRLLENGANSSFVNALVDDSKAVEELLEDPVERTQSLAQRANTRISKAKDLFGDERTNSNGIDLYDINSLVDLQYRLDHWFTDYIKNLPAHTYSNKDLVVVNPANLEEHLGAHCFDQPEDMRNKLNLAKQAYGAWSTTDVTRRAALLLQVADIIERHKEELIGLCIKEAGKVVQDAIDEVREAVDFCRYYASQAQVLCRQDNLQSRGVVLCISPWNFPLAIFLGQVAAALVTGNTVLAKPAEQTSLIAVCTLALMNAVGMPQNVVQIIVARGAEVGSTLLPDNDVQAVMFTGSTTTGSLISRELAQRGTGQVPLIAETGGQNCMIVDSTALPEQVVDDVINSGFQSAGQRCSALRVLYLQEDVADSIIAMLIGAMKCLSIGDPSYLSTDIGPVIDTRALDSLTQHADSMLSTQRLLYKCHLDPTLRGHYFPPHLFEIDHISALEREIFGPCVHVIRFKAKDLDKVMEDINETGYGLTMGIHTRIEARANDLAIRSGAGNIYVNRNMVGAVVGVQPFGGRGLSGTGPKAGGPNYLKRLMEEKATPKQYPVEDNFEDDKELVSTRDDHADAKIMMRRAKSVRLKWRLTPLLERISILRQLLAKIATVDIVDELADDLNKTLATARAQLTSIEKRLKLPMPLPGPTGEDNKLYLEPRGIIVGFADKDVAFEYWMLSIITALGTGNVVIAVVSELFFEEAMAFKQKFETTSAPDNVFQVATLSKLEALLMNPDLSGVVVDSSALRSAIIAKKLASREGAILPMITAEYNNNLIERLVTEKTISIDTTAAGGNTSLMTLAEDD
ncbi:bifunctional proline dehydrogenase/L-glutamate gamma-semialdehyde dehydrogenase PutA [Agaribacter flavus]|uniref:Bifunctional protein PutA n=1 Tax=Agaribacter flavus TaxID=1902781 RepID=A0ABV7FWU2_9ALTE